MNDDDPFPNRVTYPEMSNTIVDDDDDDDYVMIMIWQWWWDADGDDGNDNDYPQNKARSGERQILCRITRSWESNGRDLFNKKNDLYFTIIYIIYT